ncbi:MAG TPA: hypothetical protein VHP83_25955 [Aggregatilineaceae bacterium]|nr:hypothetical protein [Aggregatilineaceae bacterium]
MLNFHETTEDEFSSYGRHLWLNTDACKSHEQASQTIVQNLYEEFLNEAGEPLLPLVRIFRSTKVADLPPDLKALVNPDEQQVMALTGTYGVEAKWCDRKQSVNHKVIPLSKLAVPQRIPMFQAVLEQLGIDLDHLYNAQEFLTVHGERYKGTFFIPDVPREPVIVDKSGFVQPYGIQSLVGFGGFMGQDKSLYLLYAFAGVPIPDEGAEAFCKIQEFVGAALAKRQIFS